MRPLTARAFRPAPAPGDASLDGLPQAMTRFAREFMRNSAALAATAPSLSYETHSAAQGLAPREDAEHADFMLDCAKPACAVRVSFDRSLVLGLCDAAFGGVGTERPFADQRPLSKIERAVAGLFAAEVGAALPAAFPGGLLEPLTPQKETDAERHAFEPALSVTLLAAIHGYSGELTIELPAALIALFKAGGEGQSEARPAAQSPGAAHLSAVPVEILAVLADVAMSLEDVAGLRLGQIISLNTQAAAPVSVMSEGVELCKAKLGQNARRYCLRVL